MDEFKLESSSNLECQHIDRKCEMSDGKIKRYKEVCASCGRYMRWVPNVEALALGLNPDESWDIIKHSDL